MPNRRPLFQLLSAYAKLWLDSGLDRQSEQRFHKTLGFALNVAHCCERTNLRGHFTGSALVTNADLTACLLTHHKKLNKWLQLGGHADGDPNLDQVAMRECQEESGLERLEFFKGLMNGTEILPFDLDIHEIPARPDEPHHLHFDLRFLIVADPEESIKISEESHDVRWFDLKAAAELSQEKSMLRQFAKLKAIREGLMPSQTLNGNYT